MQGGAIVAHAWPPTVVETLVGVAVGVGIVAAYYLFLRVYVQGGDGARQQRRS